MPRALHFASEVQKPLNSSQNAFKVDVFLFAIAVLSSRALP